MTDSPFTEVLKSTVGFDLDAWGLLKAAIVLGLLLYLGFAVMIVRQVDLMGKSLNGSFDIHLKWIAWIYFGASIVVLLLAIIVL